MRIFHQFFLVIYLLVQCIWIGNIECDPKSPRFGHAAALINNKLYIYGGRIINPLSSRTNPTESLTQKDDINELIMLDLSTSFDSSNPNFNVITPSNAPNISFHGMSAGGSNNQLMVVWGGETTNSTTSNSLLYFDTTSQQMMPQDSSNAPIGRIGHSMVTGINSSMVYIFGGYGGSGSSSDQILGSTQTPGTIYNNMYGLDTSNSVSINFIPEQQSTAPGRVQHSATILSNGKIYIVGGLILSSNGGPLALASMSDIDIFDTIASSWNKSTVTNSPPDRRLHGAVGTSGNKIIIFGGANLTLQKYNDIAVLDTSNDALSWTIQKSSGTPPSPCYSHGFILAGNNAIVAYVGFKISPNNDAEKICMIIFSGNADNFTNTNIFILDITSYTWKTQYNPQNLPPPSNSITNSKTNSNQSKAINIPALVGGIVGAIVLAAAIAGLIFCLIRRQRKKQPSFMTTQYDRTQAAAPPVMGPAPVNDDLPPTIPPFTASFQKDGSLGSDTRVLNSADQRSSFASSHSLSNRSYGEQLDTGYKSGEYLSNSVPIHFEDNHSQQSLNMQSYLPENYSTQTYPPPPETYPPLPETYPPLPENYPSQTYPPPETYPPLPENYPSQTYPPPENYPSQTYPPPENYPTTPLSINTNLAQEHSSQSGFYNIQGQSYKPPSHSSQENLYRPDNRSSSPTQVTPEGDSNEGVGFKSPLFRNETLSPLAGTATTIPSDSRPLSLRTAARMSQPIGGTSSVVQPRGPSSSNEVRDDTPKGRLFVSNPDLDYE
ncbi:26161_t:CDS:2, partial [Dentiscutata erythropus]